MLLHQENECSGWDTRDQLGQHTASPPPPPTHCCPEQPRDGAREWLQSLPENKAQIGGSLSLDMAVLKLRGGGGLHWKGGGGGYPPPFKEPSLCPAIVSPRASASFNGIYNRQ